MTAAGGTRGEVDVAIVGYGPVGATLAVLLAQAGRSVAVLERWPAPYRLPRAVHMDDHVARILQSCGVGGGLRAITEPAPLYEWRSGTGATLLRLGRAGLGPSGWPVSSMFHQPALEDLLRRRVTELGVDTRCGDEVTGVAEDTDGCGPATSSAATVPAAPSGA
jgi:2-polyprenyl-6-methoxyphenol hydroxylase-like FAD-dependent oxidoreductase